MPGAAMPPLVLACSKVGCSFASHGQAARAETRTRYLKTDVSRCPLHLARLCAAGPQYAAALRIGAPCALETHPSALFFSASLLRASHAARLASPIRAFDAVRRAGERTKQPRRHKTGRSVSRSPRLATGLAACASPHGLRGERSGARRVAVVAASELTTAFSRQEGRRGRARGRCCGAGRRLRAGGAQQHGPRGQAGAGFRLQRLVRGRPRDSQQPLSAACALRGLGRQARARRASPSTAVAGRLPWRALMRLVRASPVRFASHLLRLVSRVAPRRLFVYYLGVVKALKAAGLHRNAYLIASSGGASARPPVCSRRILTLARTTRHLRPRALPSSCTPRLARAPQLPAPPDADFTLFPLRSRGMHALL